jgi:TP53 regulating kinase-like protein
MMSTSAEECSGLWQLMCQGAECRLWVGHAFGRPVVKKERFRKQYRNSDLDERLTRERTRAEVRAFVRLKENCAEIGPLMPTIWFATERELIMDLVENATTVSEYTADKSLAECVWLYELLGKTIGCIHSVGLIHGDLTTSNFLVRADRQLIPIDFGLASFSQSDEDRAVDLYVLERSLLANHVQHADGIQSILSRYSEQMRKSGAQVLRKLKEVQLRGRKRSMVG